MKTPAARTDAHGPLAAIRAGGYCVGCGVCAAVTDSPLAIELDATGRYQAVVRAGAGEGSAAARERLEAVCPFADGGEHEDELARRWFPECRSQHEALGRYEACYVGAVREGQYRQRGSSGGLGTWLLAELLRAGLVDRVLHVRAREGSAESELLFEFAISDTVEAVGQGAKSRYYPIELSRVLAEVRRTEARYAVIGLPCYLKAMRRWAAVEPVLGARLKFFVGLFCGHLKSTSFAKLLAWDCGVAPRELAGIDFRHKLADRAASDYGVAVRPRAAGAPAAVRPVRECFGSNWEYGFFQYEACDYCDDVVGETADVSVGDAWLPEYVGDSAGTNVLVVRNRVVRDLIDRGIQSGRLDLKPIAAEAVAASQAGGLRHRREGLALRLAWKDQAGQWRPRKRVPPRTDHVEERRRELYALRSEISRASHGAFQEALAAGRLELFRARLAPLLEKYQRKKHPLGERVRSKLRGQARRWLGPLWRKLKWLAKSNASC